MATPAYRTKVERILGYKLPSRVEIHHFDENHSNDENNNLVVCEDKAYHKLLHARQRVVAMGGNPSTEKVCMVCQQTKLKAEFSNVRTAYDGLGQECAGCRIKSESGLGAAKDNGLKTHCPRGHLLPEFRSGFRRRCDLCTNAMARFRRSGTPLPAEFRAEES